MTVFDMSFIRSMLFRLHLYDMKCNIGIAVRQLHVGRTTFKYVDSCIGMTLFMYCRICIGIVLMICKIVIGMELHILVVPTMVFWT